MGVAAVNGPVVHGGLRAAGAGGRRGGRVPGERRSRARLIEVDYASHGPQVEEIRDELLRELDGIRPIGTSGRTSRSTPR